jgi:hypothetical protein
LSHGEEFLFDVFAPHEEEHAADVLELIEGNRQPMTRPKQESTACGE